MWASNYVCGWKQEAFNWFIPLQNGSKHLLWVWILLLHRYIFNITHSRKSFFWGVLHLGNQKRYQMIHLLLILFWVGFILPQPINWFAICVNNITKVMCFKKICLLWCCLIFNSLLNLFPKDTHKKFYMKSLFSTFNFCFNLSLVLPNSLINFFFLKSTLIFQRPLKSVCDYFSHQYF